MFKICSKNVAFSKGLCLLAHSSTDTRSKQQFLDGSNGQLLCVCMCAFKSLLMPGNCLDGCSVFLTHFWKWFASAVTEQLGAFV